MKRLYIFLAFKTEEDYPLKPFHIQTFTDFDEMKEYSGVHSVMFKTGNYADCPDYCSTYTSIEG